MNDIKIQQFWLTFLAMTLFLVATYFFVHHYFYEPLTPPTDKGIESAPQSFPDYIEDLPIGELEGKG